MDQGASHRDEIIGFLSRVQRRVAWNRGLNDLARAAGLSLIVILVIQFLGRISWLEVVPWRLLGVLSLLALGMGIAWRLIRREGLTRSADLADRRGDLKDLLKTAYWFVRGPAETNPSSWVDLLVHRAAATAGGLDPARLIPTVLPKRFLLADGLLFSMVIVFWIASGAPSRPEQRRLVPASLTTSNEEELSQIQEQLVGADGSDARRAIDETFRRLKEGETSLSVALWELQEAEHRLSEGDLDLNALFEALDDLARDLRVASSLDPLASALEARRFDDAAERLNTLAEEISAKPSPTNLDSIREGLKRAARNDHAGLEELSKNLDEAADALQSKQAADSRQALGKAAEAARSLGDRLDARQGLNEARSQLADLRRSLAQRLPLPPPEGQPPSQPGAATATDASSEAGGLAMPGGDVQSRGPDLDGSTRRDDLDAGPAGHASGPSTGGDSLEGEPTSLEVQLEIEMLRRQEARQHPVPEEIFEKPSRQQDSLLEYREASQPSAYADQDVMTGESIPWRHRSTVKRYFLTLQAASHDYRTRKKN